MSPWTRCNHTLSRRPHHIAIPRAKEQLPRRPYHWWGLWPLRELLVSRDLQVGVAGWDAWMCCILKEMSEMPLSFSQRAAIQPAPPLLTSDTSSSAHTRISFSFRAQEKSFSSPAVKLSTAGVHWPCCTVTGRLKRSVNVFYPEAIVCYCHVTIEHFKLLKW